MSAIEHGSFPAEAELDDRLANLKSYMATSGVAFLVRYVHTTAQPADEPSRDLPVDIQKTRRCIFDMITENRVISEGRVHFRGNRRGTRKFELRLNTD